MSNRNDHPLVLNTMKQILSDVKPETTLIHSDRGSQYTSHAFNKMIHSMSRVSKCIDNGPMEGFWGTLKVEMFNLDTFDTPAYLDRKIKTYIAFFNNERVTLDMGLAIPTEEKILQTVA
ncbi:IS3 family transposase [Jeotgalibaca ciconiae]|uniref:IS3 family transposase n=1 Tax=Jeotgalibaca ciconiae TaxID=2496265 RepID=UPI001F9AEAA4|nr:DDE-type integrase/transposase/recombinase [Candidatus Jeotgalibaca pullicola]